MYARKKILSGGSVFVNARARFDGASPSPRLIVRTLIISTLIISMLIISMLIVSTLTFLELTSRTLIMLQRSTGPAGSAQRTPSHECK
jgi:hypothetical protein